ncbi:uncharacterized protein DUF4230 [Motilibacter peucedani]|uniref:Uncharacterized protein DUF4230 n=1 Tax=Motilibacter peucedani TaxID=598650 RepID=A0A420XTV7_9ACTN|nr:DUF4230 domain-containing protein [Motilibacter peucedani]RKS80089.1 uncharacterized protein DUF4230 [Motilibacter peucedani]
MALYAAPARTASRTARPVLAVVVAALLLFALGRGLGLLDLRNPFAATRTDRSGPALMKALTDLKEFHGSSAQYQQVVRIDESHKFVPGFVAGQSTTFLATGSADGIVDFSKLSPSDVVVDGKAVTITLPHAYLGQARLDATQSRVLERDRGVVDRATEALGNGGSDTAYWKAGQQKIDAAAAADPSVLARAEDNARATLTTLAGSLGYDSVTVVFADDPALSQS